MTGPARAAARFNLNLVRDRDVVHAAPHPTPHPAHFVPLLDQMSLSTACSRKSRLFTLMELA